MNASTNRIDHAFARRRASGGAAMIFYLTAGHPTLAATEAAIDGLAEAGVDIIELGIPFSDPIADGPTIQKASQAALEAGVTLRKILELTAKVRRRHPDLALVFFSAYNPIYRFGEEPFITAASEAGADGLLVPDLPPEAAVSLQQHAQRVNMSMSFLIAPTSTEARTKQIAEASTGFIYYVSVKGVTGARKMLPEDLEPRVRAIKGMTETPVAVGFGVSAPEQAQAIAGFADGVIVGSALVHLIDQEAANGNLQQKVRDYARTMVQVVGK